MSVTSAGATNKIIIHLLSCRQNTAREAVPQGENVNVTCDVFHLRKCTACATLPTMEDSGAVRKMEPIERLKAERRELIARLSKIEAVIGQHEALQRQVEELLSGEHYQSPKPNRPASKSSDQGESPERRVTADVAEFERAVREILLVAQGPMDRNELYKVCIERGVQIGGKEPLNTLASRMSRMNGVSNIRGKGYFLTERMEEMLKPDASQTLSPSVGLPDPSRANECQPGSAPGAEMPQITVSMSDFRSP
ncbi:hypothetical protein [Albidovulum sp.]|uniref:hypothetical protein n=1 Tax=Albidovulum sp. TaxID=1872424 RepID=UPI0025BDA14D|nr:hypothetical protein [Defluviimonas sp.]